MNTSKQMVKSKILVTGAAGQSGSLVIRELIKQGIAVKALVRNRNQARSWAGNSQVEIIEGDMLCKDSLHVALEGIERALLISSANAQMVETQCSFIDACKYNGVPHIIKFSGEESQIGFDPGNFRFTREHEQIEDYLEYSGLQWTHLRPSQFMQVYLREIFTIKAKGILSLPLENIQMSPVDLHDVARIAAALLISGGHQSESLRITGPQALSMADIAAIIARVIDKPVCYIPISIEEHSRALLDAGLPPFFVEAIAVQTAERRRHPQARVDLGTYQMFGVTPTYFEEFALRHAADFSK
jgi:uncharacterized protein YbjT (DUF2867 family)